MSAPLTESCPQDLEFKAPGPGSWQLDATHWPRPVTRLFASLYPEAFARGFTDGMRRYGLLILHPELRFVNGFVYSRVLPAPEHEIPERFANAARAFEAQLWREDLRRWEEEVKPASIRTHLALQRVDPWTLQAEGLLQHLEDCRIHLERMLEQHQHFTAATLVPTGDFLVQGSELSGLPPAQRLGLLRGSAPVSAGAEDGLDALAEAIRGDAEALVLLESGEDPAHVLSALRRRAGGVGQAASAYLERVECRLLDGFDLDYLCGFEMPEVLVKAIRGAVARGDRETPGQEQAQRIRERVREGDRGRFDALLAEARHTYRLRDERSIYSDVWALGLMRRAALAAGTRLATQGRIEAPAHLVEADFAEIVSLVRDGTGPAGEELAARARFRATHTAADAPRVLGGAPQGPPPLDGLPGPVARVMRAVGACLQLVFTDAEADSEERLVRGLPASPGVYEGTARVLAGPEELGRLRQGDVLVTGSTSEAFNVALPLVGAIVTDSGGLLSHAAIVAREYGIPGVVGTRLATRLIADGMRVRVDGGAGEVVVLP
jgi:rifampicin phosphotransferase